MAKQKDPLKELLLKGVNPERRFILNAPPPGWNVPLANRGVDTDPIDQRTESEPPAERRRTRRRFKRGQGAIRKRHNKFWIRYYLSGRRIEEKTDAMNETEARRILNERLGDVSKGVTPAAASRVRLNELYADVRADYLNKEQDVDTLRDRWVHLEPVFGNDFVRTITHARMQRYVDTRREEKAAPQSIKNEIAVLRRMLRLGYKNRKVGQLPSFPEIQTNNTRLVFFEDAEFERLLRALATVIADGRDIGNGWLVPFVIVARWVGARRDELLTLERRQVDLEAGKVTLDPGSTKNGDGRVFYLPPAALEALRGWDEKTQALERDRGIIVRNAFHRRGEPIRFFPYEVWRAACERAGLRDRILHDFRRTAARAYRRAGVSEGVVMKILGHKTRSIFERYNIKNEDDLREAAEAIAASKQGQVAGDVGNEQGQTGTGRANRPDRALGQEVVE
jgi:integrase